MEETEDNILDKKNELNRNNALAVLSGIGVLLFKFFVILYGYRIINNVYFSGELYEYSFIEISLLLLSIKYTTSIIFK